ncbi:3-oxoacyl-ACP synthase [Legionella gratiana]|uniref:Nodulation protein E n=1 Tax=Legionella gratiana TaxID=45066 RepID=A0A378JET1_9GAMM|nr:beta-ketoacyl-[acyl-carrier-protein] synthase family protein [Legionella gratiana]KTD12094.1 3-oxoacyl-ACP synthase [Legionella gratiana]STX46302.1 3-oxoacyl-ACP synthase [Legionella gratiana]
MKPVRVVITGLGAISALGNTHKDFWRSLCQGNSGILPLQQVDCSGMRFSAGAEVKNINMDDYFHPKELTWLDRFSQFALISAQEAIEDAKIDPNEIANDSTAVITGSCLGGKITEEAGYVRLFRQNNPRANPNIIPNVMANAGASHITAKYQITGPTYTISTACSSSTHAIGQAFWLIRQGVVNKAIAGGSEAPFTEGHLRAWNALQVVSPDTCRPFSGNRSGMIIGEGGAMVFLESLISAQSRGAPIYAEIVGFGMSADATHLTKPNSAGQCRAILSALQDAHINPEAIHYINAHGTGTLINDEIESKTIRTLFPNADEHLLVSSTKGAHGHLLGATGAIETVATALAIKHKTIPPTLNFIEKDLNCDIPLVTNQAYQFPIDYALCSSFAFGGLNAVLALRRYGSS